MRELNKISKELFNKIRARFDAVSIGDENAKRVTDPEEARFFNFDYVNRDGKNFGNITISLIDENSLKIYFSTNISTALDQTEQDEWFAFLKDIRKFARRNMLTFDTRDINRSNLDLRDISQQSKSDSTFDVGDLNIAESKLYGIGNNKHTSFADVGPHKLIIKHKEQINPEIHGSRARRIEHIFVETPIGERFLLNHTNLHGARAIANHLRHGGNIGDEGSALINEMVKEMASMRHFVRSMRNRTFEDAETSGMVEAAMHRYNEVKESLKKFKGRQGHELLMNMVGENTDIEEEIDVDDLRERFVKKIYDDRFNDALPYVYRAYKKKRNESKLSQEFESWANDITLENWDDEEDEISDINFADIIQQPIAVGVDGVDAVAALKHVINNDELNIAFKKLADSQGPDADARRVLAGWLMSEGERELANSVMQVLARQNQPQQPQPVSPAVPQQNYGASTADEPVVSEDIEMIKYLSGLVKK